MVKQLRQKIEDYVNSVGRCSTYELAEIFDKSPHIIDSICRGGGSSLIRVDREEIEKDVYNNFYSTFDEMKFKDIRDGIFSGGIDKRSVKKINRRLKKLGLSRILTSYDGVDVNELSIRDIKRYRQFQAQHK